MRGEGKLKFMIVAIFVFASISLNAQMIMPFEEEMNLLQHEELDERDESLEEAGFNVEMVSSKQGKGLVLPKAIIFDVNETLLSLEPLKVAVGNSLGGREDLLPLWFSTMLHYTLVETLSDNYHNFGQIGTAALMMVAEAQGLEIKRGDAKKSIITALQTLPPHSDVPLGLKELNKGDFHIVSLTNSSSAEIETKLKNAGLTNMFEKRYTIEKIKKYKPHPDTYNMVIEEYGVKPEEVLMVAAHAWDLAGAKNVGLQTAFIARPGKTLYPNLAAPDYIVKDLLELVDLLQKKGRGIR